MSLKFDSSMQDLAKEIKRLLPADYTLKSNHNDVGLLLELLAVYEKSESVVLNTLITELFSRAGKQWEKLLGNIKKDKPVENISEALIKEVDQANAKNTNSKQTYREQTIADILDDHSKQTKANKKQFQRGNAA